MSYDTADYEKVVWRARQIWGYVPEPNEEFVFIIIIACESPGAYSFTRAGINPGETVELIDAFTGLEGLTPAAGEDYIIKEFWISFDQPVKWEMYQDAVADYSCLGFIPAFGSDFMHGFPIGWTRAQVEAITASTTTHLRVKNLGDMVAYGKAWMVGFKKAGSYVWY